MECEHPGWYDDDADLVARCTECHKRVDPDELEWKKENADGD